MKIQVHVDHHTKGGEKFDEDVRVVVIGALFRFTDNITRVEVHVTDENGGKGSGDKRCVMEAHYVGHQPFAVTQHAASVDLAIAGASHKLEKVIETTIERLRSR